MSEVNVTQEMQELLSRLPRTEPYPFHSRLNPEYSRKHIALSLTPGNLLLLMHRAREAQNMAISYRHFKVGAALLGLSFQPSNFQMLTGVNVKPDKESQMNVHAEQTALQKAHDRHVNAVSMIVVVGDKQSDKQSGKEMHTLHPCGLCRGVMLDDALVDNHATLVVSTLPDFSEIELYSVEGLRQFHDNHDDALIQRLTLPNLPTLFDPIDTQVSTYTPEDTAQTLADERIWSEVVGSALLTRRMKLLSDL